MMEILAPRELLRLIAASLLLAQEEALTKLGERGSTAARRYVQLLYEHFPDLGEDREVARFSDRTILVEVNLADSERLGEIAERLGPVSQDILEGTGELVVAVPR